MYEYKRLLAPDVFRNKVINRQGKLGEDACKIMASALKAVDPYECVEKHINYNDKSIIIGRNLIPNPNFDRIFVLGLGKASVPMAMCVIDVLGERIDMAAVVTKDQEFLECNGYGDLLQVYIGGHPIPTGASINATKSILQSLPDLTSKDLVLVLISGGGSALFTSPVKGVSLEEFQEMTEILLKSGADINEINTLRKHLDEVKGGQLAQRLQPAQIHTLILSDVIGDNLDMIASGPTIPDPTYFADAIEIIKKYHLEKKLPVSILSYLRKGADEGCMETLKPGDTPDIQINNYLVGSNFQSAKAGLEIARSLGYNSMILSTQLTGDTHNVGEFLGGIINSEIDHAVPLQKPACLILGGETTVEVTGGGLGGRNQDLALRMVEKIADIPGLLFITMATDGEDGPTDAAGAAVDGCTFGEGADENKLQIESFIKNNNAYEYLDQLGALIKTGSTGTNVNDLVIILFR